MPTSTPAERLRGQEVRPGEASTAPRKAPAHPTRSDTRSRATWRIAGNSASTRRSSEVRSGAAGVYSGGVAGRGCSVAVSSVVVRPERWVL